MPVLNDAVLTQFSAALFSAAGVNEAEANLVGKSLVDANLRGHDSHGVMRIPFYIGKVQDGTLNPHAKLVVEKESASSLVCDGGWGPGSVSRSDATTDRQVSDVSDCLWNASPSLSHWSPG